MYWHLLHFPGGVVPHGQVNMDETTYQDGHGDSFEHAAKHSMEGATGMPVGVQIVGWPGSDEVVLRVMRELQEKAKFKIPIQFA